MLLVKGFVRNAFDFSMSRANSEFQQAVIRLVILASITVYFSLHYYLTGQEDILKQPVGFLTIYDFVAIFILLSFKIFPDSSHIRRSFTLLADLTFLSFTLHIGGDEATILVAGPLPTPHRSYHHYRCPPKWHSPYTWETEATMDWRPNAMEWRQGLHPWSTVQQPVCPSPKQL